MGIHPAIYNAEFEIRRDLSTIKAPALLQNPGETEENELYLSLDEVLGGPSFYSWEKIDSENTGPVYIVYYCELHDDIGRLSMKDVTSILGTLRRMAYAVNTLLPNVYPQLITSKEYIEHCATMHLSAVEDYTSNDHLAVTISRENPDRAYDLVFKLPAAFTAGSQYETGSTTALILNVPNISFEDMGNEELLLAKMHAEIKTMTSTD
jgi:hypothetical protein